MKHLLSLAFFFQFIFIFIRCNTEEKNGQFISNFDNDIYLIFKNITDTSAFNFVSPDNYSDSIAINYINIIANKKKYFFNDTIILKTYQKWFGGPEDYFCGASNYHLKRRIGRYYVYQDGTADTLYIGILSASVEKSFPKFIHYIDSCLKTTYFKVVQTPESIPINLDIQLDHCRIGTVVIKTNKEIDKNLINELYRIIYTSPKWELEEVEATTSEKEKGSYVREKRLNININLNKGKTEILNYQVDSTM